MKHFYIKTMILVLSSITVVCFGQNKTPNPIQNFTNPFANKPALTKTVIAPSNGVETIPTVKGAFYKNFEKENISKEEIEIKLNAFFNLKGKHTFRLLSEKTDELGFTNINFQQNFNNIPVEGCNVLLHLKNGKAISMNGKVALFSEVETQATITSEKSFAIAKDFLKVDGSLLNQYPIETVIAQVNDLEYKLAYKVRIDATNPFVMCYVYVNAVTGEVINKVDLINDSDTPGTANTLYSGSQSITNDSYSGYYRLRESSRNIQTFDATNATFTNGVGFTGQSDFTNATTTWTGVPYLSSFAISTVAQSWWYTIFADETPDLYIVVKDGASQAVYTSGYYDNTFPTVTFYPNILLQNPPYTVEIWDYDAVGGNDFGGTYSINTNTGTQNWSGGGNNGTYTNNNLNNPALDVHWGMEKTYDFYQSVFSRNSYDGNGSVIKNFVNGQVQVSGTQNNACALPAPYNCMVYGLGDGITFNPLVGLDVEGHEYSHMVIANNGNGGLTYQGESGALNESFADIFGTSVEFFGLGGGANWTIGEDVMVSAPYLRSMSNPSSGLQPQPDTYQGNYWASTSSTVDNGGVHTNSGVQNFWFYLLCQGGSGTNDLGNAYSVAGIGITQARQIAYRNLTTYLTPSATYYDAYLGSLQSAQDLYGNPSTQYDAVRDAWYAVGIGNSANSYCSGETWLTATSGTFTDGSGNANYNNNANCKWVIAPPGATQITLNFPNFDTETDYDTVFVYDGYDETATLLMTWWGNTLPPTIVSTGGALCVKFTSDVSFTYTGWTATYTSIGITPTCNGGTILSTPTGSFNDGSGGGNYGNNQVCYWFIAPPCANTVTLSFSSFNTELNYDGILVYDDLDATNQIAVLSGTTIPTPVTSNTGVMTVIFVSDYSYTLQGFAATYNSTGSAYCSGTTTLNTNDAGTFSDGSGGNNYCNNQDCRWLIQPPQATTVTLSFSAFDVEPISQDGFTIYDAVEVYDGVNTSAPLLGRFTGNTLPPTVTSTGGSLYVKFYSDILVNKQGWTANYTSTTTTYCTGTSSLTAPSGTFDDGSGANNYGNNSNCSWYIHPTNAQSITLSFTVFNTQLNHDGVVVYDGSNNTASVLGQFSGTNIPSSVTSTGGNMYVEFLSDQSTRASGWSASYNSQITGISEPLSLSGFGIYPNPSNGTFSISLPNSNEFISIIISNTLGEEVWNYSNTDKSLKQVTADLASEASGIYFAHFTLGSKTVVGKIVIDR